MKKLFRNLFVAFFTASAFVACDAVEGEDPEVFEPTLKVAFNTIGWSESDVTATKAITIEAENVVELTFADDLTDWTITIEDNNSSLVIELPENFDAASDVISGTITLTATGEEGTTPVTATVSAGYYSVEATADFEGETYTALIDSPQYGGSLLYGTWDSSVGSWGDYVMAQAYTWSAAGLSHYNSYPYYYGGGMAISNYTEDTYTYDSTNEYDAQYLYQLAVPFGASSAGGGNNSSDNFVVANSYSSFYSYSPVVISSMYVAPTSYLLDSMENGDDYATALTNSGDYFKVIATGYDSDYNYVSSTEFYLSEDGTHVDSWTKWDLSSIGAVSSVMFTFEGSDTGEWGVNTPTYFAFDDVTVLTVE